jgi:16S rRNA (adenine1518-N6/adenine1519-N6)-dimethyltransferase
MTSKPKPTKSKLGQNFLIDPSACLAIVEALGDISSATVLEIGPGKGAITRLLAPRARRLIAVELDSSLAVPLRDQLPNIEVIEQDILITNISALAPNEKLLIVGNLPYYITSQILLHLFDHHRAIDRAVIMMQREVADRIAAEPGTRDYGLLTATTQLYTRIQRLLTLPPGAFAPPPEVHSTVLRLNFEPRFETLGVDPTEFAIFLRQSFAQKRKTLANNLRFAGFSADEISDAFGQTNIPAGVRSEALPLEDSARLFLTLRADKTKTALPK